MRVLVVEDEKKTASFIRKALQAESFAADVSLGACDEVTGLASRNGSRRRTAAVFSFRQKLKSLPSASECQ